MHHYVPGVASCNCEDAADHAPCLQCGSARGAYVHVGDEAAGVVVEATDDASGSESL